MLWKEGRSLTIFELSLIVCVCVLKSARSFPFYTRFWLEFPWLYRILNKLRNHSVEKTGRYRCTSLFANKISSQSSLFVKDLCWTATYAVSSNHGWAGKTYGYINLLPRKRSTRRRWTIRWVGNSSSTWLRHILMYMYVCIPIRIWEKIKKHSDMKIRVSIFLTDRSSL